MTQGGNDAIESEDGVTTVLTKPCWICGQYSYVRVPTQAWSNFEINDQHLDLAWPQGSAEDKQLLRTGIHPKCWDEEFPINQPEES